MNSAKFIGTGLRFVTAVGATITVPLSTGPPPPPIDIKGVFSPGDSSLPPRGLYTMKSIPKGAPIISLPPSSVLLGSHPGDNFSLAPSHVAAAAYRLASSTQLHVHGPPSSLPSIFEQDRQSEEGGDGEEPTGPPVVQMEISRCEAMLTFMFASLFFQKKHLLSSTMYSCWSEATGFEEYTRRAIAPTAQVIADDEGVFDTPQSFELIAGVLACRELLARNMTDKAAEVGNADAKLLFPPVPNPALTSKQWLPPNVSRKKILDRMDESWQSAVTVAIQAGMDAAKSRILFFEGSTNKKKVLPAVLPIIDLVNHSTEQPNCELVFNAPLLQLCQQGGQRLLPSAKDRLLISTMRRHSPRFNWVTSRGEGRPDIFCKQFVDNHFDLLHSSAVVQLRARRRIPAGSELTISYVPPLAFDDDCVAWFFRYGFFP